MNFTSSPRKPVSDNGRRLNAAGKNVLNSTSSPFGEVMKFPSQSSLSSSLSVSGARPVAYPPRPNRPPSGLSGGASLSSDPGRVVSGHSSIQGCRPTMEDEHIIEEDLTVQTALFAPYVGLPCSLPPSVTMSQNRPDVSVQKICVYAVMDGHGGSAAAIFIRDNMIRILLRELQRGFSDASPGQPHPDIATALRHAVLRVDEEFLLRAVKAYQQRRGISNVEFSLEGVEDTAGSTLCLALVHPASCMVWVANAGDTRCIIAKKPALSDSAQGRHSMLSSNLGSNSHNALALSRDHKATVVDEIQRVQQAGGFVAMGRVNGELAVTRALGDAYFKRPISGTRHAKILSHAFSNTSFNSSLSLPGSNTKPPPNMIKFESGFHSNTPVTADPEIKSLKLTPEDCMLVIGCDGVWDVLSNQAVVNTVVDQVAASMNVNANVISNGYSQFGNGNSISFMGSRSRPASGQVSAQPQNQTPSPEVMTNCAKVLTSRSLDMGSMDNISAVVVYIQAMTSHHHTLQQQLLAQEVPLIQPRPTLNAQHSIGPDLNVPGTNNNVINGASLQGILPGSRYQPVSLESEQKQEVVITPNVRSEHLEQRGIRVAPLERNSRNITSVLPGQHQMTGVGHVNGVSPVKNGRRSTMGQTMTTQRQFPTSFGNTTTQKSKHPTASKVVAPLNLHLVTDAHKNNTVTAEYDVNAHNASVMRSVQSKHGTSNINMEIPVPFSPPHPSNNQDRRAHKAQGVAPRNLNVGKQGFSSTLPMNNATRWHQSQW